MPDQPPDQPHEPDADVEADAAGAEASDEEAGGFGEEPSETGRHRLWESVRHPRSTQLVVGVVLAIVGFSAVTQVRTNDNDTDYAGYRQQDLINVLSGLADTSQRAQTELRRLNDTRTQLQSDTDQRQAALTQAQAQVQALSILAGLVPVTGPGIRVTIDEQTGQVSVDSFLDLIEELRSVGAEAIQVNGKIRLVAQSSVEAAVGGLYIDHTLLTPPYTVDAIGEPATLAGAVTFARGPQDELQDDGAVVSVVQLTSMDIKSVRSDESLPQGSIGQ
jgi:uncharacterized protein YlxW (UPF0749 family)